MAGRPIHRSPALCDVPAALPNAGATFPSNHTFPKIYTFSADSFRVSLVLQDPQLVNR